MRETRLYGSEGGEAQAFPTPIEFCFVWIKFKCIDFFKELNCYNISWFFGL